MDTIGNQAIVVGIDGSANSDATLTTRSNRPGAATGLL